jgi:hypothetical protein
VFKSLKELLFPFSVIAKELTTLRELYELELSSRTPPIRRITEKPKASDTEVSYMDDDNKKRSPSQDLVEAWQREQDDHDDYGNEP